MNLSRKTLLYTLLISFLILAFFVGYLVFLLPGLYVDHSNRRHMDQFQDLHLEFVSQESYAGLSSENPMATFSLIVPRGTGDLRVYSAALEGIVTLRDERLELMLEDLKQSLADVESGVMTGDDPFELANFDSDTLSLIFGEALEALPFEFERTAYTPFEYSQEEVNVNMRRVSDRTNLLGLSIHMDNNEYMNVLALTVRNDDYVISWTSVVTASIEQILPVTTQSLPMIVLVVLGMGALASFLFSSRIVRPIQKVSEHAREMTEADYGNVQPLELETQDEISQLAGDLDALYAILQSQYRDLQEEHRRQEVYLRASSHQLKTPITASLLLVDGMIHQVGRYADTMANLPKVRDQLLRMQETVQSILELQKNGTEFHLEKVDARAALEQILQLHSVQLQERSLQVSIDGACTLMADAKLLEKVLDSLIGNAISYTEPGGTLKITLGEGIRILNTPALVDEQVFTHAFEPFVSSSLDTGRGLGLYLARTYVRMMGLELQLVRTGKGVEAYVGD